MKKISKNKIYGDKEKKQLNYLVKQLEKEFYLLRDRQPLIMDALTETLDHLKLMKKKYLSYH